MIQLPIKPTRNQAKKAARTLVKGMWNYQDLHRKAKKKARNIIRATYMSVHSDIGRAWKNQIEASRACKDAFNIPSL